MPKTPHTMVRGIADIFEKMVHDEEADLRDCSKLVKRFFDRTKERRGERRRLRMSIESTVGMGHTLVAEVPGGKGSSASRYFIKFDRADDMLDWLEGNGVAYRRLLSSGDTLEAALGQLDFETYGY